jgi:hypothetical protein
LSTDENEVDQGKIMSSTATQTSVTELNFGEWSDCIKRDCQTLDEGFKETRKQVLEQAPSWVAAHAGNSKVVRIVGTSGHPYWTRGVQQAIAHRLGKKVTLHVS